jgi:hypothetical protein
MATYIDGLLGALSALEVGDCLDVRLIHDESLEDGRVAGDDGPQVLILFGALELSLAPHAEEGAVRHADGEVDFLRPDETGVFG